MTSTDRQRISQPPPGERVESYDLVVLGGGPAGTVAAAEAARLGKRVALVERGKASTGGTLISGTLPSKTLREAAAYLGGQRARHLEGWRSVSRRGPRSTPCSTGRAPSPAASPGASAARSRSSASATTRASANSRTPTRSASTATSR